MLNLKNIKTAIKNTAVENVIKKMSQQKEQKKNVLLVEQYLRNQKIG